MTDIRERNRAWYAVNKDKAQACSKRWREQNPSASRKSTNTWRSNNQDRYKTSQKIRQAKPANVERTRARVRAWQLANPLRVRANQARRRARKANAAGDATYLQIAARVAFFGGVCSYCGGAYDDVDHAIPLVRGGTNWPANLRPACEPCNSRKGTKTVFEFLGYR